MLATVAITRVFRADVAIGAVAHCTAARHTLVVAGILHQIAVVIGANIVVRQALEIPAVVTIAGKDEVHALVFVAHVGCGRHTVVPLASWHAILVLVAAVVRTVVHKLAGEPGAAQIIGARAVVVALVVAGAVIGQRYVYTLIANADGHHTGDLVTLENGPTTCGGLSGQQALDAHAV